MTLKERMDAITYQGRKLTAMVNRAAKLGSGATTEQLRQAQREIGDARAKLETMKAEYETAKREREENIMEKNTTKALNVLQSKSKQIRSTNEYVQAFCYAVKHGLNRKNAWGNEKAKILYDALTETGGTTPGEDGGFLVPIDIDNTINELRRALNPLADLFSQETVSAPTGWRVKDTAPTTGMSLVAEMGTIATNDQPAFAKVPYSVNKYALIVPVSNELIADEAANLMAYLSRWFAKKLVITENGLLIDKLDDLTAAALKPNKTGATELDGIKTVLNVTLDPAISLGAHILTNQSGFDALDQIKDDQGLYILQPNPINPTEYRMFGRPVHVVSNAVLPNGTGTNSTADVYIGDFSQYATLFRREGFEVASTDIGGSAWRTDSTEVRGIARLGASLFDDEAVVRRTITL